MTTRLVGLSERVDALQQLTESNATVIGEQLEQIRLRLRNLERDVAKLREVHADTVLYVNGTIGPYSAAAVAMRLVKDTIEDCGDVTFSMGVDFTVSATVQGRAFSGFGPTLVTAVGDLYGNCAKAGLKVKGVTPSASPTMSA